ncbi:MAG: hypothetical protein HYZ29_35670 [Myxococcales bacterium]|nr:hypothetical protein [Myxococcales bacterium]
MQDRSDSGLDDAAPAPLTLRSGDLVEAYVPISVLPTGWLAGTFHEGATPGDWPELRFPLGLILGVQARVEDYSIEATLRIPPGTLLRRLVIQLDSN